MVVVGLFFLGRLIGPFVPFSWEVALADRVIPRVTTGDDAERRAGLQRLADRLSDHMDLPPEMKITVHFLPADTVNAAATLGGHVFVFRGLVESVTDESALAFVLAHEIAHVKHRDVIKSMGGVVLLSLAATALLGDSTTLSDLAMKGGGLTALQFGRAQETAADGAALPAVAAAYGHVHGIEKLFALFAELEKKRQSPPAILRSHPANRDRLARLREMARRNSWPAVSGGSPSTTPDR